MEKLFNDSEVYQKERPTTLTAEQKEAMYASWAQEIIDNKWSEDDKDEIIEDLKKLWIGSNSGFELAKDLEDMYGSYDFCVDFIEFLDDLNHEEYRLITKNVEEWASAHNPQPKLSKGDVRIITANLNIPSKVGDTIYINGFNEKTACYLVDKDKNRQGGYVIAYEKIESNTTPATP